MLFLLLGDTEYRPVKHAIVPMYRNNTSIPHKIKRRDNRVEWNDLLSIYISGTENRLIFEESSFEKQTYYTGIRKVRHTGGQCGTMYNVFPQFRASALLFFSRFQELPN